jgi:hypothetical protein
VLISSLRDNVLAMVGVFSQRHERIRSELDGSRRVRGSAREQLPRLQNDDGAPHKASLPFVRERLMALVAVLAAGEAAVVVAA